VAKEVRSERARLAGTIAGPFVFAAFSFQVSGFRFRVSGFVCGVKGVGCGV